MKKWLIALFLIALILSILLFITSSDGASMRTALRWCNLAPLPNDAKIISVDHIGGITWSGYRCKFSASRESVKQWLQMSRGIKTAIYDPPSTKDRVIWPSPNAGMPIKAHNTYLYKVQDTTPGIFRATVTVDTSQTIVEIWTETD